MTSSCQGPLALVVNGERRTFDAPLTVEGLLARVTPAVPRVAVLVNGEVVRREEHGRRTLRPGDAVDIISMVGGG